MLGQLRDFVRRLNAPEVHFGDDDARLALAALLVHCTGIDGSVSPAERQALHDVLARTFRLNGSDLDALIDDATAAEREAVDLYRFTSVIKQQMSEAERVRVVGDLWRIVYADGKVGEFEENLVWRIAELLAVSREDRIAEKRVVAETIAQDEPTRG